MLGIATIFHVYTHSSTPSYYLFLSYLYGGLTDVPSLDLLTLLFIIGIGYTRPCGAQALYDVIRCLELVYRVMYQIK